MAPTKPTSSSGGSKGPSRKKPNLARKSATAGPSKSKSASSSRPTGRQLKTKPGSHTNSSKPKGGGAGSTPAVKKRTRTYTDKELKLPTLNMITPARVEKARGKKKGKIFVDDEEGMMTILALVNAEKEGQIESKMIKARRMEEIREARRKELEKREEGRKEAWEGVKKGLKRGKKGARGDKDKDKGGAAVERSDGEGTREKKVKKRVSFA